MIKQETTFHKLTMKTSATFLFITYLISLFGYVSCDMSRYTNVTFIKEESLDKSAVMKQEVSRSFVECCIKCETAKVQLVSL